MTMQENEQLPRVGKAACRAFEEDFLSKIKAVRTYVCDGYVISGNKAFISHFFTFRLEGSAIPQIGGR